LLVIFIDIWHNYMISAVFMVIAYLVISKQALEYYWLLLLYATL